MLVSVCAASDPTDPKRLYVFLSCPPISPLEKFIPLLTDPEQTKGMTEKSRILSSSAFFLFLLDREWVTDEMDPFSPFLFDFFPVPTPFYMTPPYLPLLPLLRVVSSGSAPVKALPLHTRTLRFSPSALSPQ